MNGVQHKTMGIAAATSVFLNSMITGNNVEFLWGVPAVVIGVMLPDMDSNTSRLGRQRRGLTGLAKKLIIVVLVGLGAYIYGNQGLTRAIIYFCMILFTLFILKMLSRNRYINKQLGFLVMHRGIMHTMAPIVVILASTVLNLGIPYTMFCYGLSLGYFVHLVGDCATIAGAPILWPLTKHNLRYMSLKSNKHEGMLTVVSYAYSALFIAIGVFFGLVD